MYDSEGRVKEQMNSLARTALSIQNSAYEIDHETHTLTFTKFKPTDSVEYYILYKFDGPVDEGNNTEIIKQKPDGELIMRVENRFDASNLRTQKMVFDENNKLMYYYEYKYFEGTNRFSEIVKKSPENQILSKTVYTLNELDLLQDVSIWDEAGNLTTYSAYTYEFRP